MSLYKAISARKTSLQKDTQQGIKGAKLARTRSVRSLLLNFRQRPKNLLVGFHRQSYLLGFTFSKGGTKVHTPQPVTWGNEGEVHTVTSETQPFQSTTVVTVNVVNQGPLQTRK